MGTQMTQIGQILIYFSQSSENTEHKIASQINQLTN